MKYRVVTFQPVEVVDTLIKEGVYKAEKDKCGIVDFDARDINNCNGNIPIWVFQHPAFKSTDIGARQWSNMFQYFKEESGLGELYGYFMIEVLLDKQPPKGYTHNASSLACVIPEIKLEDVAGIYVICDVGDWFFCGVQPIFKYRDDVLFKEPVTFNEKMYDADDSKEYNLMDYKNAEEYYL